MTKKKWILLFFIFTLFFAGMLVYQQLPIVTRAQKPAQKNVAVQVVKPSAVYAVLKEDAVLTAEQEESSAEIEMLAEGALVELLEDRSMQRYRVRDAGTGKIGWLSGTVLSIPADTPVNRQMLTEKQISRFAASMEFQSDTPYFVWVDIDRQRVYVLEWKDRRWELVRTIVCATGKNVSPTIRGRFQLSDKGIWFYSKRLKSGAKYWVRFHDTYLFHSVAMDDNRQVTDGVLGEKRSSGCVRMSVEDAKWFYETLPKGTSVLVY